MAVAPEDKLCVRDKRRTLLLQLHQLLVANLQRVRRSPGVTAIHDSRVSARYLRVVLKTLKKECQPLLHTSLVFDLRDVGRALSPVREADVRRHHLAPILRHIKGGAEREAQRVLADLDQSRASARQELRLLQRAPHWNERLQRIASSLHSERLLALQNNADDFAWEQQALDSHLLDIRKRLKKKSGMKQGLHPLRIAVKHARYLCDSLHELGGAMDEGQLANLKKLQTALGDLHDNVQLTDWLDIQTEISPALKTVLQECLQAPCNQYRERLAELKERLLRDEM